jgi:hypothetical protein
VKSIQGETGGMTPGGIMADAMSREQFTLWRSMRPPKRETG